ncbi:hypothetical protein KIW84_040741 [Lathyrus oleraceus]|uniref:Uncharacterized protein n=1 Tax=Pisum sativum TaxID=3888 RepID=A0A9D4X9J6_PEA|nr:hypothetical protein KIW84_040741 [Pisum sativum]
MTSWKKTITTPFKKACTFFKDQPTRDHKKSQTEQERSVIDLQGEVMACGYEDVQPGDSDINADMESELADSADIATVAGTKDLEVMVAGIEQPLHVDVDNRAPETEFVEPGKFLRLIQFHLHLPLGNH